MVFKMTKEQAKETAAEIKKVWTSKGLPLKKKPSKT